MAEISLPVDHAVRTAVEGILKEADASALFERAFVKYVVETKVRDQVQAYLLSRIVPGALAVAAVLAAAGWTVKQRIDDLSEQATQSAELAKRSAVQAADEGQRALATVRHSTQAIDAQLQITQAKYDALNAQQLAMFDRAAKSWEAFYAGASNRMSAELDRSVDNARQANRIGTSVAETDLAAKRLHDDIGQLTGASLAIQNALEKQRSMLGRSVLDFFLMRSNSKTLLELPRSGQGLYRLQFETPQLSESFTLTYAVDGDAREVPINAGLIGKWMKVENTADLYEFRIDQVFHIKGAPDFITVRIRQAPGLGQNFVVRQTAGQ